MLVVQKEVGGSEFWQNYALKEGHRARDGAFIVVVPEPKRDVGDGAIGGDGGTIAYVVNEAEISPGPA